MMTSSSKHCHYAPRHGLDIRLVFALLIAMVCICLLLSGRPAWAQTNAVEPDTATVLSVARKQINEIRHILTGQIEGIDLPAQHAAILEIQSEVKSVLDTLQPHLDRVTARLLELGSCASGVHEARDIAAQRAQLEAQRRISDTQIKLARLLIVETAQMSEQISTLQRAQFQAKLGERHDAFISSVSWSELRAEFPDDLKRLKSLAQELYQAALSTPSWIWTTLGSLAVLAIAMYIGIGRWLLRLTATRVPPGRLRCSFLVVVQMVLSITVPGLVAELIRTGIVQNTALAPDTDAMLCNLVTTICFGAYVWGLGYALLSPERPSWRLLAISDVLAWRLRRVPLLLGILIVLGWLADHLPVLLNASLVTTVALNGSSALLLAGVLAYVLLQINRVHDANRTRADDNYAVAYPLWAGVLITLLWAIVIVTVGSLLVGYVAFAGFLTDQVLWMAVVLATFHVLSALIDDGFHALLGSPSRDNATQGKSGRDRAAVLLSGIFRLALLLCALALLLTHAGEAPTDLLHRLEPLHYGLSIGQVHIRPTALFQALFVLALGLVTVRILKRWLDKQFLPTTGLGPGMRLSATTLFGYAGVAISIALALSAIGIGLERVAWIASALSVGIGFGLQAVVQNFVSGLILLAERPVKVGDWVSLGNIEGDILRINVRATEIQMADRSTAIVPNSEFVTKTVRNVTYENPLGRIQIRLPMPLTTDAQQVRALILQVFNEHDDIVDTPAPNVYLDGIESPYLIFNAQAYVSSPRSSYVVRSDLLFTILKRLTDDGLELASPSTVLINPVMTEVNQTGKS